MDIFDGNKIVLSSLSGGADIAKLKEGRPSNCGIGKMMEICRESTRKRNRHRRRLVMNKMDSFRERWTFKSVACKRVNEETCGSDAQYPSVSAQSNDI